MIVARRAFAPILLAPILLMAGAFGPTPGAHAARGQVDWLLPWRWHSRLLFVFAPRADSPALLAQRSMVRPWSAGVAERDLVCIEVIGREAADARLSGGALRDAFGVPTDRFAAVLVGKDGGVKLRASEPITEAALFAAIDAMPMRRDEARRQP